MVRQSTRCPGPALLLPRRDGSRSGAFASRELPKNRPLLRQEREASGVGQGDPDCVRVPGVIPTGGGGAAAIVMTFDRIAGEVWPIESVVTVLT